jgi:hypothetical protein
MHGGLWAFGVLILVAIIFSIIYWFSNNTEYVLDIIENPDESSTNRLSVNPAHPSNLIMGIKSDSHDQRWTMTKTAIGYKNIRNATTGYIIVPVEQFSSNDILMPESSSLVELVSLRSIMPADAKPNPQYDALINTCSVFRFQAKNSGKYTYLRNTSGGIGWFTTNSNQAMIVKVSPVIPAPTSAPTPTPTPTPTKRVLSQNYGGVTLLVPNIDRAMDPSVPAIGALAEIGSTYKMSVNALTAPGSTWRMRTKPDGSGFMNITNESTNHVIDFTPKSATWLRNTSAQDSIIELVPLLPIFTTLVNSTNGQTLTSAEKEFGATYGVLKRIGPGSVAITYVSNYDAKNGFKWVESYRDALPLKLPVKLE